MMARRANSRHKALIDCIDQTEFKNCPQMVDIAKILTNDA